MKTKKSKFKILNMKISSVFRQRRKKYLNHYFNSVKKKQKGQV